jgi:hypothetical protein
LLQEVLITVWYYSELSCIASVDTHTCGPSYSGGGGREEPGSSLAQIKSAEKPYLKNKLKEKDWVWLK